MNEVQNKKIYTLKVVLITLLVVLLVGCISFIVYDKFIKKDNKENNPQTEEKDNTANNSQTEEKDNTKNDSQVENKDGLIVNGEKYKLIDINADADFDSFKVTLNACLGCGSWDFIFETETTARYVDQDIKFPKPIKYWATAGGNNISSSNNEHIEYFLLSGEGDLYAIDKSTKEIDLILSNKNVTAIANATDEDGTEIAVLKTTSGNKKIVLK